MRRSKRRCLNSLVTIQRMGNLLRYPLVEIYLVTGLVLSARQTTGSSEVAYSKILNCDLNQLNWIASHDLRYLIIPERQCTIYYFLQS